ncbi:C40 family peptidase [Streptomyces sp. PSKA54]|uniref:C40 family peptidase n=1 Tax=Streptomyces himalayensis subsp. aureolus TaxID=2758039 RepID=A0A7W2D725_9ACTN|nr:C40 family peptidase [Streptomyces himalayensis]MBA4865839.1 C40 family peptidase [Streptomyces himalayensis subsp. aureolus]
MGKTGKAGLTTAAVALVCAVTVLTAPGVAYANSYANPAKPAPGPTPAPTPTTADDKDLEKVRKELDRLYHDAAVATDEYNAAEERAGEQSDELVKLARKIVKGQEKLDELKERVGAAARAQYRSGGLPPQAQLMLSDDPRLFLDGAGRVREGQQATKGLLAELTRTQQDLQAYAKDASTQWQRLEANRKAKAAAKKKIKSRIADAEKLEAKLEKEERERLLELEQETAYQNQAAWLSSGILEEINGKASAQGKKAVTYATAQIGKPYEWGAEGPKTYDCSGLTSQAWAAAGRGIPRTSQEQWKQLPRIDIKDMRPGDLIIYHDDASHVGMYIGDGAIVHAPRPGRTVTIAGAGSMAILGVVRPDR